MSGRCLNPVYPEYDRSFSLSTVLCGAAVGGRFACGSVSGHLFIWTGRKLERAVRAHELGITCVWGSTAGALTCSKVTRPARYPCRRRCLLFIPAAGWSHQAVDAELGARAQLHLVRGGRASAAGPRALSGRPAGSCGRPAQLHPGLHCQR